MLKLSDFHSVHFIGVCGVSMKALALLCARAEMRVSGSDKADSPVIETLCKNGIYAYRGSDPSVAEKAELVVYTACIPENDPELARARECRLTVMERKAFLTLVERMCERTVAVAGTHGKTTTTAMLSAIMSAQGVKFIGHVGGDLPGGEIKYLFSEPYNAKMPDYHRLDLGCNIHSKTRRGNESVWNIIIYNAYCRMNPVFMRTTINDEGRPKATVYSLVPIIPSFSYTL